VADRKGGADSGSTAEDAPLVDDDDGALSTKKTPGQHRDRTDRRADRTKARESKAKDKDKDKDRKAKEKDRGERLNPFSRLIRFVREVVAELRKVIYPTRKELVTYAVVVIVFLVLMTSFVAGADYGLARLILLVFGSGDAGGDGGG